MFLRQSFTVFPRLDSDLLCSPRLVQNVRSSSCLHAGAIMCTTTPSLVFLPLRWGHSVHQHPKLGQAALEAMWGSLYLFLTWSYKKYIFPSLSRDYIKKRVWGIVTINIRYHFYYCVPWLAFQQSGRHIPCVLSNRIVFTTVWRKQETMLPICIFWNLTMK